MFLIDVTGDKLTIRKSDSGNIGGEVLLNFNNHKKTEAVAHDHPLGIPPEVQAAALTVVGRLIGNAPITDMAGKALESFNKASTRGPFCPDCYSHDTCAKCGKEFEIPHLGPKVVGPSREAADADPETE